MQASRVSCYRVEVELLIKHFMYLMRRVFVQRRKSKNVDFLNGIVETFYFSIVCLGSEINKRRYELLYFIV